MSEIAFGGDREPESCRDEWHVFEWSPNGDALTCHCGQRTIAVVLKQVTAAEVLETAP